jgi:hypothetical protein
MTTPLDVGPAGSAQREEESPLAVLPRLCLDPAVAPYTDGRSPEEGACVARPGSIGVGVSDGILIVTISRAVFVGTADRRPHGSDVGRFCSGPTGRARHMHSSAGVLHGTWPKDERSHLGLETPMPATQE